MSDTLSHVPAVAVAPPLRCYFQVGSSGSQVCGDFARWMRPGLHWFDPQYFCDQHRSAIDVLIPAEHVFRRVRVQLEVLIAAAALNTPAAHPEALARLYHAVGSAGGLVDVQGVRSSVVKSSPQASAGLAIAARIGPV